MIEHLALFRSYRKMLVEQLGGKFDDECFVFDWHTRVSTTLDIYSQFIDVADDEAAAI